MKHLPIFVALHPSAKAGQTTSEKQYAQLFQQLRASIRMSGFEDKVSSMDVLRFRFERLISALVSVHEALDTFRSNLNNDEEKALPLPIKFIFHHIEHPNDPLPPFCETGSSIWSALKNEQVYVSRSLKLKWQELQESNKQIHCRFELEDEGIYRAEFTQEQQFNSERLFKYRHLLLIGNEKECFYCGMRNHTPNRCPSKFLTMETQGIQKLGYLPFQQINEIFVSIFQNPGEVQSKLEAGISPSQLVKDRNLLVYTSFFDLFRIFQPRFFTKITFGKVPKWVDLTSSEARRLSIDDSNINLAIDCLRVGKYDEAEKKFLAATGHQEEKIFYAYIGLAFVSLEKGRLHDMGKFLDTACSNAIKEKEKIYIHLLLSRYFKLVGDLWKAQSSLNSALAIQHDLIEASYFNAIIEVTSGFSEKAMNELRSTLRGPKEYFMVLMLDPQLLPFHGFIDEILQTKLEIVKKEADEKIATAKSAMYSASAWLEPEDERQKNLDKLMADIQQHHETANFYDCVDVIEQSRELNIACKEIKENCLDEVVEKKKLVMKRFNSFISFWNSFPNKSFFKKTLGQINDSKKKLAHLERLIKTKQAESYKKALGIITEVEELNSKLEAASKKMRQVALLISHLKSYGRKLVIVEIALLLLVLPIGLLLFPDSSFATNSSYQRKIFLSTGLFLGPIIALGLSFIEFSKKPPVLKMNKKKARS